MGRQFPGGHLQRLSKVLLRAAFAAQEIHLRLRQNRVFADVRLADVEATGSRDISRSDACRGPRGGSAWRDT
jgi:hypothetical protein